MLVSWAVLSNRRDTCLPAYLGVLVKNGKSGWHSHMTVFCVHIKHSAYGWQKRGSIQSVLAQVKCSINTTITTLKIKHRGKVLVCSTICSDIFTSGQKALCVILFFSSLLENIPLVTRASRHTSGSSQRSQHIPYEVQRKSQDSAEGLVSDAK